MRAASKDDPDLRDYQSAAVHAAAGCERGLTVMACGTGKTRVAAHAALNDSGLQQVVVFVPTLALLEQTYNAWAEIGATRFSALGVCSQPIRGSEDIALADLTLPTTTDAETLAEHVHRSRKSRTPTVVFATYQSAAVIAEAHRNHDLPAWTTMVCDEAHRLAGPRRKAFGIVLTDDTIPARRRLFYTATPRIHAAGDGIALGEEVTPKTVASMDNTTLFGERLYTLPTRDAIDQGWLSDYRLAIIAVTADEIRETLSRFAKVSVGDHTITTRDAATIIALHKAVDDYSLRSVLTFHNTISASQQFTAAIEPINNALGDTRPVTATHVDGTDSLTIRRDALTTLHTPPDDGWAIVSNARCFSEGIDVPALDAVLFAEARTSPIDVAQSVGRAIRKNPNRSEPSLIILAVIVDTNEEPENAIEESEFAKTRRVIAALEDHDPAIATDLTKLRQRAAGGDPPTTEDAADEEEELHVDVRAYDANNRLLDRYLTAFTTRLLPLTHDRRWEEQYNDLQGFVAEHGHAQPPNRGPLGVWVSTQRNSYRVGTLDASRAERLEALDGWVWNALDARWEEQFAELQEFVAEYGHVRPPRRSALGSWVSNQRASHCVGTLDASRAERLEALDGWAWWNALDARWEEQFAELQEFVAEHGHARPPQSTPVGQWVVNQRAGHRVGTLDASRAERLEALDGWVWNALDARWEEQFAELQEFVAEHGHACPPAQTALGSFVAGQRRNYRAGTLTESRAERLEELDVGWVCSTFEARWEEQFAELQEFVAEHGHAHPSVSTGLGGWVSNQRASHRAGTLDASRAERLEALDGWVWNALDARWEEQFAELQEFVAEHGHACPAQRSKLGTWVSTQRRSHRAGTLADSRAERLARLGGWVWNARDARSTSEGNAAP